MNSKICTKCGKDKPLDQYHKRANRPLGVKSLCKDCANLQRKEYYDVCKENGSLKEEIWRRAGIEMTFPEYQRRYEEQEGCCEICEEAYDVLCVDHNHITGEIRGLICTKCNLGIENLQESPKVLNKAVEYLMKYGGRNVSDSH